MSRWNQLGATALIEALLPPRPVSGQATEAAGVCAEALDVLPAPAGALSLDEVYRMARDRNPMLKAAGALADATATREASAALPRSPPPIQRKDTWGSRLR
jgi:hypothetical protein